MTTDSAVADSTPNVATDPTMANKRLINLLRGWPSPTLLPSSILQSAANRALSDPTISTPALQYAPDEGPLLLRKALSAFLSGFYHPRDHGAATSGDHNNNPKPSIDIDRITTTGGASQNFGITLGALTDPSYTRRVWVIQPTYFLAFRIIGDAGLTVEAVEDSGPDFQGDNGTGGIDFDTWDARLAKVEKEAVQQGWTKPRYKPMTRPWPTKIYKNVFYCVPSFSNPTGRCMPLLARELMVRLARKYDALIITDDVYDCLWWDTKAQDGSKTPGTLKSVIPRIVDVDRYLDGGPERAEADGFGNAMSNGSFSKICGPGVRTGWIEAAPPLAFAMSQAGPIRSGGASSNLTGILLALTLESGELQRHITHDLIPAYHERWKAMMQTVDKLLVPLGVTLPYKEISIQALAAAAKPKSERAISVDSVAGGYFMWLKLPDGIDATFFANRLKDDQNVIVQTESQCRTPSSGLNVSHTNGTSDQQEGDRNKPSNSCLRLCFAWEDTDALIEGVERMARTLTNVRKLSREETSAPSKEAMAMLGTNQFR